MDLEQGQFSKDQAIAPSSNSSWLPSRRSWRIIGPIGMRPTGNRQQDLRQPRRLISRLLIQTVPASNRASPPLEKLAGKRQQQWQND